MLKIGVDLDYFTTVIPDFVNALTRLFSGDGSEIFIISSMVPEVGDLVENFKYRVEQLEKLGVHGFDVMVLTDGKGLKGLAESKKSLCSQLKIDLLFDDEPIFVEDCKEVCHVLQFHKMGLNQLTKGDYPRGDE